MRIGTLQQNLVVFAISTSAILAGTQAEAGWRTFPSAACQVEYSELQADYWNGRTNHLTADMVAAPDYRNTAMHLICPIVEDHTYTKQGKHLHADFDAVYDSWSSYVYACVDYEDSLGGSCMQAQYARNDVDGPVSIDIAPDSTFLGAWQTIYHYGYLAVRVGTTSNPEVNRYQSFKGYYLWD